MPKKLILLTLTNSPSEISNNRLTLDCESSFLVTSTLANVLPVFEVDVCCTLIQPSVESTKTNVADSPSVDKVALAAKPPILLEPFGVIV